ncbi:hypothetical protein K435DRAFT_771731 [Dendrothele bispora CBS 962.96]|uniref:Decapping nuclease n=1 Tax=Dendrothele bispora (strain CBS 962.96) TaxID=1314807 RepID=A0A4S8MXM7_DENBC|nr:hypothetical protein K435DRAFT_771731 [Dendrothele bispora CBS 962.96]
MISHTRQSRKSVAFSLKASRNLQTQQPTLAQTHSESCSSDASTDAEYHFLSHDYAPRLAHVRMGTPRQVACYSRTGTNHFIYNENSSLRRFVPLTSGGEVRIPAIKFNGGQSKLPEIHRPKRVDQLLQACLESEKGRIALLKTDVVLPRNVLVKMIHGVGKFNVSYANGRLFFEEHEDEGKKLFQVTKLGMLAKYGFQFKYSYPYYYPKSRLNIPNGLNDWSAVIERSIGGLNILMSGEVDCVKGAYSSNPDCYLDLHSRPFGSSSFPHLGKNHWKDLKDWFFRMYLMGIPELFLGLRNTGNNNTVVQTHFLHTEDIPNIVNSLEKYMNRPPWDPQDAVVRAFQTLYVLRDWVQETVDSLEAMPQKGKKKEDFVWRVEMRGKRENGLYVRELSKGENERLWCVKENPSWKRDGEALPLPDWKKKYGIVNRALIRKLRALDLGSMS